jgi:hypothetical protein
VARTRHSSELSRAQLVGMIATLRGALIALLDGSPIDREADVADARDAMKQTTFDASSKDAPGGTFDMSWRK